MKTISHYTAVVVFLLFISCQPDTGAGSAKIKASADMAIEGMVCAFGCAKSIEDKMAKTDGIISSEVNFAENKAHFVFDKSVVSSADIEKIIEQMNDGQYKVEILHEEIEENKTEPSSEKTSVEPISEQRASFSFPQLATYFMHNL